MPEGDGSISTTDAAGENCGTEARMGIVSTGANAVTAASKIEDGRVSVRVWNNGDAAFVDGKTFSLIAF